MIINGMIDKTKHTHREFLIFDENEEKFRPVTNILDIPFEGIIDLYKKRCKIDSFFIEIEKFLG